MNKFPLTPSMRRLVAHAREQLNAAIAQPDNLRADLGRHEAKADALASELAAEGPRLNVLDEAAVQKFNAKGDQERRIRQKIAVLIDQIERAERAVFHLYTECQRIAGEAHRLEYEQTRSSAIAAIAPFYGPDSPLAHGVVEQFPRVRQLAWFVGNSGVADTPSVEQARKLLAILDAALLGKSSFEFVLE